MSETSDTITLHELEVFYHVGVPETERRYRQRLLLTLELAVDTRAAATADDLSRTVDYAALAGHLLAYGENRSWRLIETLAQDLAGWTLATYPPIGAAAVTVTKFAVPQARAVTVRVRRVRADRALGTTAS